VAVVFRAKLDTVRLAGTAVVNTDPLLLGGPAVLSLVVVVAMRGLWGRLGGGEELEDIGRFGGDEDGDGWCDSAGILARMGLEEEAAAARRSAITAAGG
jgi:hypothetical protein